MNMKLATLNLTVFACLAALATTAPAQAQFVEGGGAIGYGADSLEVINAGDTIRLLGRANVWQGEARIMADRLDIHFADGSSRTAESPAVERIEALGRVAYLTPLERALGDNGVYVASTQTIELTGAVVLIQGETVLTGDRLVIQSQSGEAELTGGPGQRIRGVLGVEKEEEASAADSDQGAE